MYKRQYLSGIVVDAWKQGLLEDYEIVGVMGRTPETVSEMAKKAGCVACLTLDELLAPVSYTHRCV